MQESTEYYKALAEYREFTIDTILKPSIEIVTVMGVVFSMIQEVQEFGKKSGKNKKYQETLDKILTIQSFLEGSNKISDHNYQLRYMLRRSMIDRDRQNIEIENLKNELSSIKKAFNEEL